MATYRYTAIDLRTGQVREEVPLNAVRYGRMLNGGGTFDASLPLSAQVGKDLYEATVPGKTLLWIDRDGVPVGAYIIWTRSKVSGEASAALSGSEVWSYFHRRLVRWPVRWVEKDTAVAACELLTSAQGQVGGDIRVVVPSGATSGVTVTRTVYSTEDRFVAEEILDLSGRGRGFTFDIVPRMDDAGTRSLNFTINPRGSEQLGAKYPGNVQKFDLTDDASVMATAVRVQGGGNAATQAAASGYTVYGDALDEGFPLLESTISAPSVTNADSLADFIDGVAGLRRRGVQFGAVTVLPDSPAIGTYAPGDQVRLMLDDGPMFKDAVVTLLGYDVETPSGGAGERVVWRTSDSVGGGA